MMKMQANIDRKTTTATVVYDELDVGIC